MPTQSDKTNDSQGRANLTLTVNATTTGANWSAAVSDGSTNYGGWSSGAGSWTVNIDGQPVVSTSGKSYDFGSGVLSNPYFPRSASGSVTLGPGTYNANATFSGDGSTVGTANVSFSFTVAASAPAAFTNTPYLGGIVGNSYSDYVASVGATNITITSGSLPPGLSGAWESSTSGFRVTGTPSTAGTYSFGLTATNTGGSTNYSASITITGGSTPTTFSYSYDSNGGSNTPSGATVNAGTGIPLGSPGTRSGYTFTGWYSSATGITYNAGASYTVNASTTFTAQWTQDGGGATYPPAWTDNTIAAFVAGKTYSDTVTASNMNYSGAYSVSSGSLPSGISLNTSTGALTGTVTSATDYSFTITATNSYSSVQQAFSGSIAGAIRVYADGQWVKKVARVYDNGEWKPATVNMFSNSSWSPAL
jgi:uncharacterized repeat protein (TIGR02543 family)